MYMQELEFVTIIVTWPKWCDLSTCNTTQNAFISGTQYVSGSVYHGSQKPQLGLSSSELDIVDARLIVAARTATLHFTAPGRSKFVAFHAGAALTLRAMNLDFFNTTSTDRLKKTKECLEITMHDHFVRLMHMVLCDGICEQDAQRKYKALEDLANVCLGISSIRFAI